VYVKADPVVHFLKEAKSDKKRPEKSGLLL
jgi:hypothetical protein